MRPRLLYIFAGTLTFSSTLAIAAIALHFRQMNGFLLATATITIPAGGQKALLLSQVPGFGSLPTVRGVLRVTSSTPISVMGLRARYNERRDFLITTTPATSEAAAPVGPLYFPHIADSGGFTTQFILFSATPEQQPYSGAVQFFSPSGEPLSLNLR